MIGIIKRCNMPKAKPLNPDDYFDPTTHIATEENFIRFLEAGGKYDDKSLVGYKVQLSQTSGYYNNGIWVIADVGHHADQPNTYDLIPQDVFYYTAFDDGSPYQYWRDSLPRTWLNSTFYSGFSENFKSHMNNITYDSNGSTYNDDKIILPSYTEVNGGTSSYAIAEGTAYPIFTDNNNRKKYQTGTTTYRAWWTRSRYILDSGYVWCVGIGGSMGYDYYGTSRYLAPILRVS